jgi:hypothetical protein
MAAGRGSSARGERGVNRRQHVEHRLLPGLGLAARLHRLDRGGEAQGRGRRGRASGGSALPSVMNSVP